MSDKLTIEEIKIALGKQSNPMLRDLAFKQIADTMRENERLRKALDKKGCAACDPAKYYAVMGDPRVSVSIPLGQPYKHSDDDIAQVRRIKRKLEHKHSQGFDYEATILETGEKITLHYPSKTP